MIQLVTVNAGLATFMLTVDLRRLPGLTARHRAALVVLAAAADATGALPPDPGDYVARMLRVPVRTAGGSLRWLKECGLVVPGESGLRFAGRPGTPPVVLPDGRLQLTFTRRAGGVLDDHGMIAELALDLLHHASGRTTASISVPEIAAVAHLDVETVAVRRLLLTGPAPRPRHDH